MVLTSNLGVQGQFISDQPPAKNEVKDNKEKPQTKPATSSKDDPTEIFYEMDIKSN